MISYCVVPKKFDKNVKKLLLKVVSDYEPEYVPIKVEDYALNGHCYNNVREKVKRDGGSIYYGWAVYQTEYLTEAEKHAVWEDNEGNLIDITPNTIENIKEILFIPDNVFQGDDVDNIRINNNPKLKVIDDFIILFQIKSKLYNDFGERVDNFKMNIPSDILQKIRELENLINDYQNYIEFIKNANSKCICGSNKSYNNCHSNITVNELNQYLKSFLKNRNFFNTFVPI